MERVALLKSSPRNLALSKARDTPADVTRSPNGGAG